jgi:hypothetical protein
MAGLVPAIHVVDTPRKKDVDARHRSSRSASTRHRSAPKLLSEDGTAGHDEPLLRRSGSIGGHAANQMHDRILAGEHAPSDAETSALDIEEGTGNAGSWPPPWPACKQKTQAAVTTGSAESSGIPCAMVLP